MNHVQLVSVYAVSIFVAAEVAALLAHCVRKATQLVSFLNIFGGGVLLAAGFVHLLPDAVDMLNAPDSNATGGNSSGGGGDDDDDDVFPWAFFVCSAAIYGFIVLETAVLKCHEWAFRDRDGATVASGAAKTVTVGDGKAENASGGGGGGESGQLTEQLLPTPAPAPPAMGARPRHNSSSSSHKNVSVIEAAVADPAEGGGVSDGGHHNGHWHHHAQERQPQGHHGHGNGHGNGHGHAPAHGAVPHHTHLGSHHRHHDAVGDDDKHGSTATNDDDDEFGTVGGPRDEESVHDHSVDIGHGHSHGFADLAHAGEGDDRHRNHSVNLGHGHSHGFQDLGSASGDQGAADGDDEDGSDRRPSKKAARRAYLAAMLLILGLSLHSFLAGFSLGVAGDDGTADAAFIAIIAHKSVAAIAVAAAMLKTNPVVWKYWVAMMTFGLVTPTGIFIGLAAEGDLDGSATGVLVAMTAGTFVYVALLEIYQPEATNETHIMWKLLLMGVGWGFMSMLALWV